MGGMPNSARAVWHGRQCCATQNALRTHHKETLIAPDICVTIACYSYMEFDCHATYGGKELQVPQTPA